jgi:hypothetical protein
MLFNFKPSKKLACLTLAASIFASHSTAISIKTNAPSEKSSRPRVVNCVTVVAPAQVSTDAHSHSVVVSEGEQIPVRIDISRCDPALAGSAQPWTVSLLGRSERRNVRSYPTVRFVRSLTLGLFQTWRDINMNLLHCHSLRLGWIRET